MIGAKVRKAVFYLAERHPNFRLLIVTYLKNNSLHGISSVALQ